MYFIYLTSSLLHNSTQCRCSVIIDVYAVSVYVLRRPNRGWETVHTSSVFSSVFLLSLKSFNSRNSARHFGQDEKYGGVTTVIKPS